MSTKLKEAIFREILRANRGDYIIQAQVAAAIHPEGWKLSKIAITKMNMVCLWCRIVTPLKLAFWGIKS